MYQALEGSLDTSSLKGGQDESDDSASIKGLEEDYFPSHGRLDRSPQSTPMRCHMSWLTYMIVSMVWVITIAVAICFPRQKRPNCDGLAGVFDTELGPIKPAIEIQKVRFLGNLEFAENDTLKKIFWDSDTPRYTGEPSDELDARWSSLLKTVSVSLRGIEAETMRGKTYQEPGGGFLVGIEVFHELHCLNQIRRGLRRDYYTKHAPEPDYTTHIDHCLDHLRQAVMCNVDVTLIPFFWDEKHNTSLPDFQVEHTCRNFWKVRDWAIERAT
ncbi:hypothetical protein N7537_010443 [Penicillium hordei]|uniref:Cyclochlorotine biosynthesis protein O n=1 Tax=Penicillium hordei TaxID=40994 RepID=A0AAD6DUN0_9EURO|nr:uncharacterized protein N7537_010443 [Penicillium hordei]KAJ5593539.1 hypothetical protein N7537_010443 [Penicillium hordei]